jgi:isoleucyl-tRNA synthetase
LLDWPTAGRVDELEIDRMTFVREVINEGLSQRAKAGIKVRQPLPNITIDSAPAVFENVDFEYEYMIIQELNVKSVGHNVTPGELVITLDTNITPELKREGLMREVVRHVQSARKTAGLNVDDHILLRLETADEELKKAMKEYESVIKTETLADDIATVTDNQTVVTIEGSELTIALKKA